MPGRNLEAEVLLANVRATFDKCLDIVERKNHDYGAAVDAFANFRAVEVIGLSVEQGILVRTLDKLMRVNSLLVHEAYVTEESMEDTIEDAINYLAILKAFRQIHRYSQTPLRDSPAKEC